MRPEIIFVATDWYVVPNNISEVYILVDSLPTTILLPLGAVLIQGSRVWVKDQMGTSRTNPITVRLQDITRIDDENSFVINLQREGGFQVRIIMDE